MRKKSSEPLHRRNILLSQRGIERIASLRTKTEATTDTEVVRHALALYERVIDGVLSGQRLQFVAPDNGVREIELLFGSGSEGGS